MNPSQSGLSGVVVGSTVGPEGSVPLSTADEFLEVSPRRARQFADPDRLVVVDHGPPMPVSHTSVREVSEARSESGQTVAVRTSKSLLSGDLAAAIDLIRDEHAATLAALDARLMDLAAHRDTLSAEVDRQRATMEREREWAAVPARVRLAPLAQRRSQIHRGAHPTEDWYSREWAPAGGVAEVTDLVAALVEFIKVNAKPLGLSGLKA